MVGTLAHGVINGPGPTAEEVNPQVKVLHDRARELEQQLYECQQKDNGW